MRHFLHELTYLEALYINGEAKIKTEKILRNILVMSIMKYVNNPITLITMIFKH